MWYNDTTSPKFRGVMPFFILNAVLFGTTMVMTYDTIAKSKQK